LPNKLQGSRVDVNSETIVAIQIKKHGDAFPVFVSRIGIMLISGASVLILSK